MIPLPGTPAGDRLRAVTDRWSAAATALRRLRVELHDHRIHPEIAYDMGPPRLVIGDALTVWTDRAGTVFCWSAAYMEEPADHASADDLPEVARRLAERLAAGQ
ncbi:hypothetical protein FHS43_000111 [Streptosporangium becharense]|uniref:Uncharacterized protein n=1 Tax=Streptosporangium becharense TaxID=1816182 RepID=A0A7W9IG91_9ACTN|nr:hypothetical protein [Streptosporangium becharense]MBB2908865.1 hypothetical protein [Streptosporangium becharense]MBB5820117.1 hypothetical protein [Streptosporangium becharense]